MGETYRVLLVDDNLINREVAAAMLESYDFEVTEAQSGAEAVDLVRKTKFHMIFMDHRMPGMDGVETVRVIRGECGENGSSPVIIALTADVSADIKDRFIKEGFQDVLQKPLDREELERILDSWCRNFSGKERRQDAEPSGEKAGRMEEIHIDGIDITEAKKHHTGGAEDYVNLLQLYCMDGRRKLELLVKLLKERDYANYGVEVHGLKSASANVGAMALSVRAREQEEAAKRKDTAYIAGSSREFLEGYARQLQLIERFLRSRDRETGKAVKGACLEQKEVLRQVRMALEYLENFRSRESAEIVDSLLKHELESSVEEELREIKGQLIMYEDDEAERLLRELADRLDKED